MALHRDGTVWAWGTRDDGALGGSDVKPAGSLRVLSALAPVAVPGLEGITQIAVGATHNLALTRDGHVMSWGTNSSGELGVGTRITGWTPATVTGLDSVVAIAAGTSGGHGVSGAVRQDGTVWMWGSGTSAMMGNGQGPTAPDDPGGRNLLPTQLARLTFDSGRHQRSPQFRHTAVAGCSHAWMLGCVPVRVLGCTVLRCSARGTWHLGTSGSHPAPGHPPTLVVM